MKKLTILGAFLFLGLSTGLPALAQNCSNVEFRLWRQGQPPTWYSHGETVEVYAGEEVHLYIHQRSNSGSHYSTAAELGYPANFGFRDDSRKVRQYVRMTATNADDKRNGRVRFVGEAAGTTRLGYRINGVKSPGDLNRIPGPCRTGAVNISVITRTAAPTPPPAGRPNDVRAAATDLVEILYRGLLRRDRHGSDPESFVNQVVQQGKNGLEGIAETMTSSNEFRYEALKRVEGADSRASLPELRSRLLDSIYRDLYGYVEPDRRDQEADLADLDECLSDSRGATEACGRLGRNLVDSRLFFDKHQDKINNLPIRGNNRRFR